MEKKKLAIFASGTGSNAVNLIRYFNNSDNINIAFVLSNNENAGIIQSAKELDTKVIVCSNKEAADGDFLVRVCQEHKVDWIVLAGYLRLIPNSLITEFQDKIINLHPSLLPKYGGKGMHGRNVHQAVLENKEDHTGITIHFVNEEFDKGRIIAQFHCALDDVDGISEIEAKIKYLEQSYLPTVVNATIMME